MLLAVLRCCANRMPAGAAEGAAPRALCPCAYAILSEEGGLSRLCNRLPERGKAKRRACGNSESQHSEGG